jgi:hypothetical protein
MATKKTAKLSVESFEQASLFKPWTRRLAVKNKDPKYDYRVINDTPDSLEFRAEQGWEPDVVTETATEGQPDEFRRPVAGMIVVRRPKEISEMHKEALRRRSLKKMRGPIEEFKASARRSGVEAIDSSKFYRGPLLAGLSEPDDDDK